MNICEWIVIVLIGAIIWDIIGTTLCVGIDKLIDIIRYR